MAAIKYSDKYKQPNKAEFGKLNDLITDELVNLCKDKKRIIIYGHAKSGKILIAKELSRLLNFKLIVSDDYMHLGFKDAMYHIKEIAMLSNEPLIIEGVQASRLLRKGVELNDFFSDLIIHTEINIPSLMLSYQRDGEAHKINNVINFNEKVIDKIFYEWYEIQLKYYSNKLPEIIKINTSFV